jgi:hypothetical protein
MKVTVCELPDETARREHAWADLVRYLLRPRRTSSSCRRCAEVDLSAVDRARQTYPRNLVIP